MQARLRMNAAVFRRRQRKSIGAGSISALSPENLITARLRRLAVLSMRKRTGLMALFSGSSGTGKTMTNALARSLGKKVHRVALSEIADTSTRSENFIGETEKNLSRLFAHARKRNIILFFDEADALFGKRTELADSHDKYANQEVSYLLARIARHRGIVLLSTNKQADIDPAIARRFDTVVSFAPS